MAKRIEQAPKRLSEGGASPSAGALLARARSAELSAPPGTRERIWREMSAPAPSRRWVWASGGVAGLAAAAAAIFLFVGRGPGPGPAAPFAVVAVASGDVKSAQGGGALASAARGQVLAPGARLRVEGRGRAYARFADAAAMLGDGSEATLDTREGGRLEVALREGTVSMAADHRPRARALTVAAFDYRVEIVGTVFAVRAGPDGDVEVRVHEGVVRVTGPGTAIEVRAGESWSKRAGAAHEAMDGGDVAGVTSLLRGEDPAALPPPAPIPAPVPPIPAPPREPATPSHPASDELDYQRAQRLVRSGHPAVAATLYARLATGSGARAEAALYEMGRLRHGALSDDQGALAAFEEYRRRFPQGALRQEVELSVIETELAMPDPSAADRDLDAFLEAWPRSERRDELRLVRANLRRDRGDCTRALVDYEALAHHPTRGDDATFFAASCAKQSGDAEDARRRLEGYLERFPSGRHAAEARAALGAR